MLTNKEIKERVDLMQMGGIAEKHIDYFVASALDAENDDIISLIDDLSSKTWWLAVAYGSDEMRSRGEAQLEARQKLIEKIKGLRRNG